MASWKTWWEVKMRSKLKDGGAAAVELALVLPLLLLLVFGIVDFGRAYNAQITLSNAARESVRVWALGGTQEEATQRAEDTAVGLSVTGVTFDSTSCTFGATTTVTVTAAFTYLTPLISELSPGLSSLSTDGVMRCGG
jgi:Flp pilus assembly protein TadG